MGFDVKECPQATIVWAEFGHSFNSKMPIKEKA
jgi:hypothetical protein